MIVQGILNAVMAIVGAVFRALPTMTLGPLYSTVDSTLTSVGAYMRPWDAFLPLSELTAILQLVVTVWLPALVIYVIANWVWRHIPDLWGFGPGAG